MKTAITISIFILTIFFLGIILEIRSARSAQSERPVKSIAICFITMDDHGKLKAEILPPNIGMGILFINGFICDFVKDHWIKDGTCRLCGAAPLGVPSDARINF